MVDLLRDRALFGDELVCPVHAPFKLRAGTLDARDVARLAQRNLAMLKSVALLESELPVAAHDDDEDGAWFRVEAKIDLMLEMIGALMRRDGDHAMSTLRCARSGIAGTVSTPIAAGGAIARLEVHALVPQPLEWPGTVEVGAADDDGTPFWFRFAPMPDALLGAWERHLFRLHRRDVAQARRRA